MRPLGNVLQQRVPPAAAWRQHRLIRPVALLGNVPRSELRPQSNVVLRGGLGVAARRHFEQVLLLGREIGPLLYLRANHVSGEQRGQALLGLGQRQRCGLGLRPRDGFGAQVGAALAASSGTRVTLRTGRSAARSFRFSRTPHPAAQTLPVWLRLVRYRLRCFC